MADNDSSDAMQQGILDADKIWFSHHRFLTWSRVFGRFWQQHPAIHFCLLQSSIVVEIDNGSQTNDFVS